MSNKFPPYFSSFLKQPRGSGASEMQQKNRYLHSQLGLETGRSYLKNFLRKKKILRVFGHVRVTKKMQRNLKSFCSFSVSR